MASQRTGAPFLASPRGCALHLVRGSPSRTKSSDAVERRSCYALLERLPQDAADANCRRRARVARFRSGGSGSTLWSCVAAVASSETIEHANKSRIDVSRGPRAPSRASKDRYHARSVSQHVAKLCDALSDPSEVVDALMNSGSAPSRRPSRSQASGASAAASCAWRRRPAQPIERVAKSLAKTEPQRRGPFIYLALGVDATASCGAVLAAAPQAGPT